MSYLCGEGLLFFIAIRGPPLSLWPISDSREHHRSILIGVEVKEAARRQSAIGIPKEVNTIPVHRRIDPRDPVCHDLLKQLGNGGDDSFRRRANDKAVGPGFTVPTPLQKSSLIHIWAISVLGRPTWQDDD